MRNNRPRLRMFAGPNGSGKSTMKSVLNPKLVGAYVNADELEKEIRANGTVDLRPFGAHPQSGEVVEFFASSSLMRRVGVATTEANIQVIDQKLAFFDMVVDS